MHAEEQEERYRDPEFRLEDEFHGLVLPRGFDRLLDLGLGGATPISWRTMSAATSAATAFTSLHGRSLGRLDARLGFGAFLASSLSSLARSAAVSAFSLARPSSTIACAFCFASASACS